MPQPSSDKPLPLIFLERWTSIHDRRHGRLDIRDRAGHYLSVPSSPLGLVFSCLVLATRERRKPTRFSLLRHCRSGCCVSQRIFAGFAQALQPYPRDCRWVACRLETCSAPGRGESEQPITAGVQGDGYRPHGLKQTLVIISQELEALLACPTELGMIPC